MDGWTDGQRCGHDPCTRLYNIITSRGTMIEACMLLRISADARHRGVLKYAAYATTRAAPKSGSQKRHHGAVVVHMAQLEQPFVAQMHELQGYSVEMN